MKHRNAKPARKSSSTKPVVKKPALRVVDRSNTAAIRGCLAERADLLTPLLELIVNAKASIDELMTDAARGMVEQLLVLSAIEVAGEKRAGIADGDIRWHGKQAGRIVLAERKLQVERPRLRRKGAGGGEVPIPAYERLNQEAGLADRIQDILLAGVSTRQYAKVLPKMVGTVGISKSQVSRDFIKASETALETLMARRFDKLDLLAIYLDGIIVDGHHILAGVGVDSAGAKHLLGLSQGSSENAAIVKDLLEGLIARGLDAKQSYLFIIDGSKALRTGIDALFGERAHVQRCRTHKLRNVLERIADKAIKAQTRAVMQAAYKLPEKDGVAKMKQQAAWLKRDYPDAAASLLEGLAEMFTVNRLGLTPKLMRCLATTNIIENPNGTVRRVNRRVTNYQDAKMALRWTGAAFLTAEMGFRKIQGVNELWILANALGRTKQNVDQTRKAA